MKGLMLTTGWLATVIAPGRQPGAWLVAGLAATSLFAGRLTAEDNAAPPGRTSNTLNPPLIVPFETAAN
jgi:hypothetical protein